MKEAYIRIRVEGAVDGVPNVLEYVSHLLSPMYTTNSTKTGKRDGVSERGLLLAETRDRPFLIPYLEMRDGVQNLDEPGVISPRDKQYASKRERFWGVIRNSRKGSTSDL